jgi:hypothetical protein
MLHGDVKGVIDNRQGSKCKFRLTVSKLIYFKMSQEDMTPLRHEGLSIELIRQDWPY